MSSPSPAFTSAGREREDFPGGPIRVGSDGHRELFCRTLLDTFNPYKPAVIDWPHLDEDALARLVALPIWDIAVQTEGRARLNVASYASEVSDPLLRRAVELNAFEEGRHILFFVNWAAWHRRRMPVWRRPYFELKVLAVWTFLVWERIGISRNVGGAPEDNNFTLSASKSVHEDISVGELLQTYLSENERRMNPYDRRLLRPRFVPALARWALRFIRPRRAVPTP
jgi:hypothetical protein